jgi:hypothetical protein
MPSPNTFSRNPIWKAMASSSLLWISSTAFAAIEFDQPATPDVIFGSGNANGEFTTDRRNGIELGLRGKVRFPVPQNEFGSNGDGSYSFEAGDACLQGFSFARCETTPKWSFEWTVNVDVDGTNDRPLGDLTYELGMDGDPGPGTDFLVFDNLSTSLLVPFWDHATGTNSTPNGGGDTASDSPTYEMFLTENNVAQNSWNYEFFNNLGTSLETFDPKEDGNYVIYLAAKDPNNGRVLAKTQIQILVGNARAYRQFRSQAQK